MFTDVFVWREAFEGLEWLGEALGAEAISKLFAGLAVGVAVVATDCGFLDRAVHAFDLAVDPGIVGQNQAMIDADLGACEFEGVGLEQFSIFGGGPDVSGSRAFVPRRREVGPIVGEHGVDRVWDRVDQPAQEVGSCRSGGPRMEFSEG